MKTEPLTGHSIPVKARIAKLSKARKHISNYFPLNVWLISIFMVPAILEFMLFSITLPSISSVLQSYFVSVVFGAALSLPLLLLGCFVFWILVRCSCSLPVARIFFLFVLLISVAIGWAYIPDKQVFGYDIPENVLFIASLSVLLPGVWQAFELK